MSKLLKGLLSLQQTDISHTTITRELDEKLVLPSLPLFKGKREGILKM